MPLSNARQLDEATKLYQDFTGHKGKIIEDYESPDGQPGTGAKFGKLDLIGVKKGEGKTFWIDFRGAGQPAIGASFDGKRMYVLGGHYPELNKKFGNGVDLGAIVAIAYTARRDGKSESYIHDFRPKSRPRLTLNKRGFLEIVGGAFRFKDTGINDA